MTLLFLKTIGAHREWTSGLWVVMKEIALRSVATRNEVATAGPIEVRQRWVTATRVP